MTLLGYNTPVHNPPVALIDKQELVGLDGIAHLATGAPWLGSHDGADDVRRCLDELASISPGL